MKNQFKLRQKTFGIFIKPYKEVGSEANGNLQNMTCGESIQGLIPYVGMAYVSGGSPWMLYRTTTSFVEARKIVKYVMDEIGHDQDEIMVTEIIPTDHVITPLS